MLKKYNRIDGVPKSHYYLTEIKQFMDFETPQIEEIIYTSADKQELVDLCSKNDWACFESKNDKSGWYTHYIKQRK